MLRRACTQVCGEYSEHASAERLHVEENGLMAKRYEREERKVRREAGNWILDILCSDWPIYRFRPGAGERYALTLRIEQEKQGNHSVAIIVRHV